MKNKGISLKNFIVYEEKGIVSKNILNSKNGNITLFSFDKNESLKEHKTPFKVFIYIVEGKIEFKIKKEKFIIKEGEFLLMEPETPHSLKAIEKSKMLLFMLK